MLYSLVLDLFEAEHHRDAKTRAMFSRIYELLDELGMPADSPARQIVNSPQRTERQKRYAAYLMAHKASTIHSERWT